MRSAVFFAALVAAVSAQLRIETPQGATECQPARIMWSGGSAPYFPAVLPGGQPSAVALKSFPQTNDMALTWTVDLPAGTRVTMRITDGTGAVNYAEQVTIQAGSNKSCLTSGTSSNSTAAASGSSAASAASGAAVAAVSSAPSAATSSAAGVASSASSAASAARSSVSGAASSVSATASSVTGAAASAARSGAAAASSAAAAFHGAEPKLVGGLLGVVAGVVGVLAL